MFVPDADMDRTCLRQGDVLRAIPFPILELKNLAVLGEIHGFEHKTGVPAMLTPVRTVHRGGDPYYFAGQTKFRLCLCTVVSNCCEIQPRNNKILPPAFLAARLIDVKKSILEDPAKLASLRSNKDPRDVANPGYIDYFYLTQHELLEGKEWMVDFSQVVSIASSEFPGILERKVLQMDERTRVQLKLKLATYFGRVSPEEEQAGFENPWT